jgi:F-box protein 21
MRTLPLSLVAIFVAICRRLGIPAAAVSFPGHVHAFVPLTSEISPRSPWASYYDAMQKGVHIDVYHSNTQPFIDVISILRQGQQAELKPSSTNDMVFRACHNILTSVQLHRNIAAWELELSVYAVFCVFLLGQVEGNTPARDFVQHIMAIVAQHYPLDVGPVLQKTLAPALRGVVRESIEKKCLEIIDEQNKYDQPVDRAEVRYFSGLVFVHRTFE